MENFEANLAAFDSLHHHYLAWTLSIIIDREVAHGR
jgi:hypothetical protein